MPGRILLCYDGSENARAAITTAGRLLGGGPALVASAWSPVSADRVALAIPGLDVAVGHAVEELDRIGADYARNCAEEGCALAEDAGFSAEPLPLEAPHGVWAALVSAADEHDAGLIVLGERGRSPVASAVLGSVSNGVLHHARRPVMVVPPSGGTTPR